MRFTMRHTIDTDEATYWRLFFDPSLIRRMYLDDMEMQNFEELEFREDPEGNRTRRIRALPKREPPAAVSKLLGDLTAIETGYFDAKTRILKFEIVLPSMAERITIVGDMMIAPGRTPGTLDRIVNVEIKVSIFGIGSVFESFIEKVVREHFSKDVAFINRTLAEQGLSPKG